MSLATFEPHIAQKSSSSSCSRGERGGSCSPSLIISTRNDQSSPNSNKNKNKNKNKNENNKNKNKNVSPLSNSNSNTTTTSLKRSPFDFPAFNKEEYSNNGYSMEQQRQSLEFPRNGSVSTRLQDKSKKWNHLFVLPVLLLEFLAIALTRAVLPSILLQEYGNNVYLVLGCADCIRGLLAFVACPLFGKISDVVGRRLCLLVTVIGSCAPVCSLALFSWDDHHSEGLPRPSQLLPANDTYSDHNNITNHNNLKRILMNITEAVTTAEPDDESASAAVWPTLSAGDDQHDIQGNTSEWHGQRQHPLPPNAITIFVILLALSGIFSSTFTLVFAYISDTVRQREERVSAYGLALATFGLSFTIGPMAGGYLAKTNTHYVFISSFVLTVLDVLYIYFILPESREGIFLSHDGQDTTSDTNTIASTASTIRALSWSPWDTLRVIATDPFLRRVGQVAFLYYTGLWAIISTLSLYAVKQFHLSPERLGELMSSLGLCTMIAEAVLVRIIVPMIGEKQAARLGLLSFGVQCIVLGLAYEGWHLFVCVAFSILGNLVYPSLSSLVSGFVEPATVGEALGAVNGVKALTEGIGPLIFGTLMTLSEKSQLPGWPYILASFIVFAAYRVANDLPDLQNEQEEYIHELDVLKRNLWRKDSRKTTADQEKMEDTTGSGIMMQQLLPSLGLITTQNNNMDDDDDYETHPLLSDIDESEDDEVRRSAPHTDRAALPLTFGFLLKPSSNRPNTSR